MRVFLLSLAALAAGCATPRNDLVVVLPEEGGKVGAVVVTDGKKRETALNAGYASARSDSPGLLELDRRSEEHTSELQSQSNLVCRLLLEKKNRHSQKRTGCWKPC